MNDEIKYEIEKEVKKQISIELDKTYRKIIRRKNFKIFIKNTLILALILFSSFLTYILYKEGYFNKYFVKEKIIVKKEIIEKENLIDKYSYLLDNIYINDKSEYVKDFYEGNLTNELKNYLTLNLIDLEKYSDDITVIDNDTFKKAYNTLFDDYKEINFIYNNSNIKYVKKLNSYVSNNSINKEETRIKREITNIEEKENLIEINTIEYVFKHDKKYNILTNKEETDIENLNKIKYIFKDNKLIKIEK